MPPAGRISPEGPTITAPDHDCADLRATSVRITKSIAIVIPHPGRVLTPTTGTTKTEVPDHHTLREPHPDPAARQTGRPFADNRR